VEIRPGDLERHRVGIVDAGARHLEQGEQVVVGR
jgi:hypothetical protein